MEKLLAYLNIESSYARHTAICYIIASAIASFLVHLTGLIIALLVGAIIAMVIGVWKESCDAEKKRKEGKGEGWSWTDIACDLAGTAFACWNVYVSTL